jgi:hypothetical protein
VFKRDTTAVAVAGVVAVAAAAGGGVRGIYEEREETVAGEIPLTVAVAGLLGERTPRCDEVTAAALTEEELFADVGIGLLKLKGCLPPPLTGDVTILLLQPLLLAFCLGEVGVTGVSALLLLECLAEVLVAVAAVAAGERFLLPSSTGNRELLLLIFEPNATGVLGYGTDLLALLVITPVDDDDDDESTGN